MTRTFKRRPSPRPTASVCRQAICDTLEARRLFAAGDLDPSFGGDGDVSYGDPSAGLEGFDVAVQPDGKTVVVGEIIAGGTAIIRYNLNGTHDSSFGPDHNGVILRPGGYEAGGVAIQADGKIVVVSSNRYDNTRVLRYNPDGGPDSTFDDDGIAFLNPGSFSDHLHFDAVLVQADGKIVLGGTGYTGFLDHDNDMVFARLNADGSLDSGFGDDGVKIVGFGDDEAFAAMTLDYSGTPATNPHFGGIVAAGNKQFTQDPFSGLLVRLTTGGERDPQFGTDGGITFGAPGGPGTTNAAAVVVQDDGRIVVAGTAYGQYVLARFTHGGGLDPTFGNVGWSSVAPGAVNFARDLLIAPSGGLIVGGGSRATESSPLHDVLAFFDANGGRDVRFGGNGLREFNFGGDLALAAGPGRRFVFAGGRDLHAARFLDFGANVVYATTLNQTASENGPTARSFVLFRVERVPYATRVYFDVGGTATAPYFRARNPDYSVDGMAFPIEILGGGPPYAEIPANQTFTTVIITPNDDALVEGNETATFTIRPDAAYEVGDPRGASFIIVDNDAPPPSVAAVYVRGSAWKGSDGDAANVTFGEYLAAKGLGDADLGYRVDNLPAGSVLPWTNVNQLVLRYSAPPTGAGIPAPGAVTLDGVRSDYSVTGVNQLDAQTFLLTLDRPLGSDAAGGSDGDRIRVTVPGGAAGAPYGLTINPLPGDVNRSGSVVANDFSEVKSRFFRNTNSPITGTNDYSPFHDVDGSGSILATDFSEVKKRFFDNLPPAAASPAPAQAPAQATALFGDLRVRPGSRSLLEPAPA